MSDAAHSAAPTADVVDLLHEIAANIDYIAPVTLPAVVSAGAHLVAVASSRLASAGPRVVMSETMSPMPTLASLPPITKGPNKGERWMTKRQFAAWCTVSVATVSDWIYTGRIMVTKRGNQKQARVFIASGERERLRPPVVDRSRKGEAA